MNGLDWRKLTTSPSALEFYYYGRGKHRRSGRQIQYTFNKARRNARLRKKSWDLTPEQFASLWRDDCVLCGITFSAKGGRWNTRSLDRLDDSIGYTFSNVRLACYECNTMRKLNEINAERSAKKAAEFEPFL